MRKRVAISVIVPVHNAQTHLRKCLNSILQQTFKDLEVIIVNDGSTDESGEICNEYIARDDRIQVIHQEKKGVSTARNIGLSKASGDFIGFVDSDDYIDRKMYEKLYEACLTTKSNIAICKLGRELDGEIINDLDDGCYAIELSNEAAMRELFTGKLYRFSLCNKLFSKKCFADITFPVGRIHEDLSTTYKLFAEAEKAVYLNYLGYIYVKQEESILTTAYYEKRLDAFTGWEEIIHFMKKEYPQLIDIVHACFIYNSIDHIYYIYYQVKNDKKKQAYLNYIQSYVRQHYHKSMINKLVSVKNKLVISLFLLNVPMFLFVLKVKSKL